jgi:transcriptional regulator with XRE-family HTH domain
LLIFVKLLRLEDVREHLGARIQHYRDLKGLSQRTLASAMGTHFQTLSGWENGRSWPEFGQLEKIAKHLDIDVLDLFDDIKKPPKSVSPQRALDILQAHINERPKLTKIEGGPHAEVVSVLGSLDDDEAAQLLFEINRIIAARASDPGSSSKKDI